MPDRSQLTESVGKMLAIFRSEIARGFEGTGGRDDATILIKAGLQRVIAGAATLDDVFYRGKGGSESIFLAPRVRSTRRPRLGRRAAAPPRFPETEDRPAREDHAEVLALMVKCQDNMSALANLTTAHKILMTKKS